MHSMNEDRSASSKTANYSVKNIETVIVGTDVQARVFTLAPGESIPWHYHKESTDHYFVLEGTLTINSGKPEDTYTLTVGKAHKITPGTPHLIANKSKEDCRFLLLQGVGSYDWIKVNN